LPGREDAVLTLCKRPDRGSCLPVPHSDPLPTRTASNFLPPRGEI
jgi:hypothetical protein